MQTENTTFTGLELVKKLDSQRTQGTFVTFLNPLSKSNQYIIKSIPSEVYTHYVISEETSDEETLANAEYTTLALNNFKNVTEALEGLLKLHRNTTEDGSAEYGFIQRAKEALEAIK